MIPKLHLKIVERFREIFGQKGEVKLYFAPGKVNIIGELIDYSGGNTITAAILLGGQGVNGSSILDLKPSLVQNLKDT